MRYPATEFTDSTAKARAALDVGLCDRCGSPQFVQVVPLTVAEEFKPIGWDIASVQCDNPDCPDPPA